MSVIAKSGIQPATSIEQTLPQKPNFALVFGLAGAALLICLVLALIFLDVEGGHIHLRHRDRHPTSKLSFPASEAAYFEAGESEA